MSKHIGVAVAVVLIAVGAVSEYASSQPSGKGRPAIRLNRPSDTATQATFDVVGLDPAELAKLAGAKLEPDQWKALLAVYVAGAAEDRDRPAMLGSYRVEGDVLRFEPRFPLAPGVRYRVVFDPSRLPGRTGKHESVVAEFTLPKPKPTTPTVVTQVYPTRNKLPENHLRFYIHFSAPMSQGHAYRHIHLFNAEGKEIETPFLELGEELWDAQGKRFTLFLDPGRVKRDLKPRRDFGPILEEGKTYTLVIDRDWPDANGNPLKESYRKTFQAVALDEQAIDPKAWKIEPPAPGQRGPLTVTFPKPLDHAQLHRLLWVVDAKGRRLAGTVKVTDEETRWHFTPEQSWQAGTYRLVADVTLEDSVGNSIARPFEVDVFPPIERQIKTETVELPFEVRALPE
ncbi:MAG TPA: hypothetical protein VNK04_15045 [Gemmataceae bacterium]|nr:hypothetical protein [Gemmataceae bacterium]